MGSSLGVPFIFLIGDMLSIRNQKKADVKVFLMSNILSNLADDDSMIEKCSLKIKHATLARHQSLERVALLQPLSGKHLNSENYRLILEKFYGFFSPLEVLINRFEIVIHLPDYPMRRKSTVLLSDIDYLNKERDTHPSIPLCTDLPNVESLETAFGCLYVMEGSTLGGRFIYKAIEETLAFKQGHGASFFFGYGAETGAKWKLFQQALDQICSGGNDDSTIAAANETFFKFQNWLNTNGG